MTKDMSGEKKNFQTCFGSLKFFASPRSSAEPDVTMLAFCLSAIEASKFVYAKF